MQIGSLNDAKKIVILTDRSSSGPQVNAATSLLSHCPPAWYIETMTIKLVHTSDWQIGKVFRFADNAVMGLIQEARLGAISRIGGIARTHGAGHVLVAGDAYDMEALSPRSLNQPLERMQNFPNVNWHLLPGNYDPHHPNGLWDQC